MNARTTTPGKPYAYALFADEVPSEHVSVPEVHDAVEAAGKTIFGKGGFVEAFGGDRCRKPPKRDYWQVTYVNSNRFLPRECLKHLVELSEARR